MCADDDIHLSFLQVGQHFLRLFGRTCSGEVFHTDGKLLQSGREGLVVLIGQHRRRHHHRHLLAVGGCLEGGADGHFGLAEAHIATHQAVHRTWLLHVGFHVLRGFQLVGRVFVGEGGLQFVLHVAVLAVGKAFLLQSGSIEADEVAGDVLHLRLHTLLHAFPSVATNPVQRGWLALLSFIFRDFV